MWVVVLNDGETFTAEDGCAVLWVPRTVEGDDVDEFVQEHAANGLRVSDLHAAWERSVR